MTARLGMKAGRRADRPRMAAIYFDPAREMEGAYNRWLRLVQSARQIGIKPTGRGNELELIRLAS